MEKNKKLIETVSASEKTKSLLNIFKFYKYENKNNQKSDLLNQV